MRRFNKIISAIVLISFLFNTVLTDLAFSQQATADKLAISSRFNHLTNLDSANMMKIEAAIQAQLLTAAGKDVSINPTSLAKVRFSIPDVQFFTHEIDTTLPNGRLSIKCRVTDSKKDTKPVTYYAVFSPNKDADGKFPINIYTEEDYTRIIPLSRHQKAYPQEPLPMYESADRASAAGASASKDREIRFHGLVLTRLKDESVIIGENIRAKLIKFIPGGEIRVRLTGPRYALIDYRSGIDIVDKRDGSRSITYIRRNEEVIVLRVGSDVVKIVLAHYTTSGRPAVHFIVDAPKHIRVDREEVRLSKEKYGIRGKPRTSASGVEGKKIKFEQTYPNLRSIPGQTILTYKSQTDKEAYLKVGGILLYGLFWHKGTLDFAAFEEAEDDTMRQVPIPLLYQHMIDAIQQEPIPSLLMNSILQEPGNYPTKMDFWIGRKIELRVRYLVTVTDDGERGEEASTIMTIDASKAGEVIIDKADGTWRYTQVGQEVKVERIKDQPHTSSSRTKTLLNRTELTLLHGMKGRIRIIEKDIGAFQLSPRLERDKKKRKIMEGLVRRSKRSIKELLSLISRIEMSKDESVFTYLKELDTKCFKFGRFIRAQLLWEFLVLVNKDETALSNIMLKSLEDLTNFSSALANSVVLRRIEPRSSSSGTEPTSSEDAGKYSYEILAKDDVLTLEGSAYDLVLVSIPNPMTVVVGFSHKSEDTHLGGRVRSYEIEKQIDKGKTIVTPDGTHEITLFGTGTGGTYTFLNVVPIAASRASSSPSTLRLGSGPMVSEAEPSTSLGASAEPFDKLRANAEPVEAEQRRSTSGTEELEPVVRDVYAWRHEAIADALLSAAGDIKVVRVSSNLKPTPEEFEREHLGKPLDLEQFDIKQNMLSWQIIDDIRVTAKIGGGSAFGGSFTKQIGDEQVRVFISAYKISDSELQITIDYEEIRRPGVILIKHFDRKTVILRLNESANMIVKAAIELTQAIEAAPGSTAEREPAKDRILAAETNFHDTLRNADIGALKEASIRLAELDKRKYKDIIAQIERYIKIQTTAMSISGREIPPIVDKKIAPTIELEHLKQEIADIGVLLEEAIELRDGPKVKHLHLVKKQLETELRRLEAEVQPPAAAPKDVPRTSSSGMQVEATRLARSSKLEAQREIEEAISLANEAGFEIPTHPDTRYTLLMAEQFYANGELAAHKLKYGDRFDLDRVSGQSPEQFVTNVLSKARGKEARTVVLVPDDLPQAQLEQLAGLGIRFLRTNITTLIKARSDKDSYRAKFQLDTYAMMLLVRRIDQDMDKASPLYRTLSFYIRSHISLDGIAIDDYINAILNSDVARLIKAYLSYKPAAPYDVPEYGTVEATLVSV